MTKIQLILGSKLLITLSVFLLLVAFLYMLNNNSSKSNKLSNNPTLANNNLRSPLEDLTVPYLRSRKYFSKLGTLDKIAENSNYTSYLTNYDSDGFRINALLTVPAGNIPKKGFPAIVFVHGYIPPDQYQTLQRYIDYVDYLGRNGFVVFKIDLRGNGTSQGRPEGAYFSSAYVIDTLNAYSALQNANFINPKEIGLWGHSMAGNVVLRAMVVKPTIPATVIWAGAVYSYVDQTEYGIHDLSYVRPANAARFGSGRQSVFQLMGTPSANNTFWKTVAPTTYLNDLKGAVQIHHALDDTTVDIRYSEELNSLLNETPVRHEFYTYPTGGHNISGASFDLAMQRTVSFFDKYLKGE